MSYVKKIKEYSVMKMDTYLVPKSHGSCHLIGFFDKSSYEERLIMKFDDLGRLR
ncbi:hypothetical protein [Bulleidia extructa]